MNAIPGKSSSRRGVFAALRERFLDWLNEPLPRLGECSFREFLSTGQTFVENLGVEKDNHATMCAIVHGILACDVSVDLDASLIVWFNMWETVTLPQEADYTPTDVLLEVIGQRAYYVGLSQYPLGFDAGHLVRTSHRPKERYRSAMHMPVSGDDMTPDRLGAIVARALSQLGAS